MSTGFTICYSRGVQKYNDNIFLENKLSCFVDKGQYIALVEKYIAIRDLESHRAILRVVVRANQLYGIKNNSSLLATEPPKLSEDIDVISNWLAKYTITNNTSDRYIRCPYESIKGADDAKKYIKSALLCTKEWNMFSARELAYRIVGIAHYYQDIYRDPELAEVFDIAADLERGDTEEGARRTGIDKIAMLVS